MRTVGLSRKVAVFILAVSLLLPKPVHAQSFTETYAKLRPSIALVLAAIPSGIATGTAFCLSSDHTHSLLLTNRHVIAGASKISVLLENQTPVEASVLRVGVGFNDAAILDVPIGDVPAVVISTKPPTPGQDIALAGFPRTQVQLIASGVGTSPAVHRGTVSALVAGNALIEYDAHSEHGNSGSPLFDPETGAVYGIETYGLGQTGAVNLAIAFAPLVPFLQNARVAFNDVAAAPATVTNPAIDASACSAAFTVAQDGLRGWMKWYPDYMQDYNKMVEAGKAVKDVRNHDQVATALSATQTTLGSVDYIITYVEPKLAVAKSKLSNTGAINTETYLNGLIDTIMQFDYYQQRALRSEVNRYEHLLSNPNRYAGDFDLTDMTDANEATQSILEGLKNPPPNAPCAG